MLSIAQDIFYSILFVAILPPFALGWPILGMSCFFHWRQQMLHRRIWKPSYWWVLSQMLFIVASILVGVLFAAPPTKGPPFHHADPLVLFSLKAFLWSSLASAAFWIWRISHFRRLVFGFMLSFEFSLLSALFMAGMSVTGDWI